MHTPGRRGTEGAGIALLKTVEWLGFEKGQAPHRPQFTQLAVRSGLEAEAPAFGTATFSPY